MDDINISVVFHIQMLSPKTQNTVSKIYLFLISTLPALHEKEAQTRLVEGTLILPYPFHFSLQIQQYLKTMHFLASLTISTNFMIKKINLQIMELHLNEEEDKK